MNGFEWLKIMNNMDLPYRLYVFLGKNGPMSSYVKIMFYKAIVGHFVT